MCHRLLLAVVFGFCCLTGAESGSAQQGALIQADIVYGHKDGLAMTMDVLRPDADPNGAGITFIVSGGWVSQWSSPESFRAFFAGYLKKGYTIYIVRHGSSPRYGIADAVADVRRAVRHIRLHAPDNAVDPDRIGVVGMSAGGHLALMLATTGDDGNAEANDPVEATSSRIACAVAAVPPTDLRIAVWEAEESLPAYRNFPALNMSVDEAAKYSPRLFVTEDDAPSLVVSGTQDELVPDKHGRWIAEAFEEAGVEHRLMLLDTNHGLEGKQQEAFGAMEEWFDKHLVD